MFFAGAVHADSATIRGAKEDIQKVKTELNTKMEQIDSEIRSAKAKGVATQEKAIKELEESKLKLQKDIDDLKDDGKQSWKKLKARMSDAVDNFAAKVRKTLKE